MDYKLTVEYGECDYPMTVEALEFFLTNPTVLLLSEDWRVTDEQFQTKPAFRSRECGYRIEFKINDA